jgi:hypothetical protein
VPTIVSLTVSIMLNLGLDAPREIVVIVMAIRLGIEPIAGIIDILYNLIDRNCATGEPFNCLEGQRLITRS